MGQDRRKALVVILYGNLGMSLAPTVVEILHPYHVLAGLTIGLHGLSYHDALHLLTLDVRLYILIEHRSLDGTQPSSDNLKRVGYRERNI